VNSKHVIFPEIPAPAAVRVLVNICRSYASAAGHETAGQARRQSKMHAQ
jgi:hypothetical protein